MDRRVGLAASKSYKNPFKNQTYLKNFEKDFLKILSAATPIKGPRIDRIQRISNLTVRGVSHREVKHIISPRPPIFTRKTSIHYQQVTRPSSFVVQSLSSCCPVVVQSMTGQQLDNNWTTTGQRTKVIRCGSGISAGLCPRCGKIE